MSQKLRRGRRQTNRRMPGRTEERDGVAKEGANDPFERIPRATVQVTLVDLADSIGPECAACREWQARRASVPEPAEGPLATAADRAKEKGYAEDR